MNAFKWIEMTGVRMAIGFNRRNQFETIMIYGQRQEKKTILYKNTQTQYNTKSEKYKMKQNVRRQCNVVTATNS